MTNSERRDQGLAYIADETVLHEMTACKKKLKRVNELDRWEYEKINRHSRSRKSVRYLSYARSL